MELGDIYSADFIHIRHWKNTGVVEPPYLLAKLCYVDAPNPVYKNLFVWCRI